MNSKGSYLQTKLLWNFMFCNIKSASLPASLELHMKGLDWSFILKLDFFLAFDEVYFICIDDLSIVFQRKQPHGEVSWQLIWCKQATTHSDFCVVLVKVPITHFGFLGKLEDSFYLWTCPRWRISSEHSHDWIHKRIYEVSVCIR